MVPLDQVFTRNPEALTDLSQGQARIAMAAFEHYMLADDRPDSHPMTFWVRFHLEGCPDCGRWESSLRWAFSRHPLARSKVVGNPLDPSRNLYWQAHQSHSIPLFWGIAGQPLPYDQGRAAINLFEETGIRFFVLADGSNSIVLMQCHHAVTDALGAVRFFEDVLAHYGDRPDLAPDVDPNHLARRRLFGLSPGQIFWRMWRDVGRISHFFSKFPQPLVDHRHDQQHFDRDKFPASICHEFSQNEICQIRAAAKKSGATLNDILLRDAFVAINNWKTDRSQQGHVRVAMAINMRREGDEVIPMANFVSMCFLDRSLTAIADHDALLQSIAVETGYIKRHYMGFALILATNTLGLLRGGMKWSVTPKWPWLCSTTAVLSNLGEPLKGSPLPRDTQGRIVARELALTGLELLPPVRPNTPAAFGVATEGGKMRITLHYDHTAFSVAAAANLMEHLAAKIRGSISA